MVYSGLQKWSQLFFPPEMRDGMGVLPAKPGNISWGLPVGLKANCVTEFKTFLTCLEIVLTTRVVRYVGVVTPFLLKVFHGAEKNHESLS